MKKTGIELIAEERKEQIEKHGFDSKHDDMHDDGLLIEAAIVCASNYIVYWKQTFANGQSFQAMEVSSWELPVKYNGNVLLPNTDNSTKKERIHQLKVAGALIAAEIDRLQRLNN